MPLDELVRSAPVPNVHASTFHEAERLAIINALQACRGRIAGRGGAAERLGLKRTTLQRKMSRLNISRSDYDPRTGWCALLTNQWRRAK